MILSVSRRTDIPQFYSQWFFHRLKEGSLCVRNPFNSRQISRIDLSPETVEFIVFWTKNPKPMLSRIKELGEIPYYIQFTLTSYGKDVEPGLSEKEELLEVFKEAAGLCQAKRMVWRYDPIFLNDKYTEEFHIRRFERMAEALKGHTKKVVISFLDMYGKTKRNMKEIPVISLKEEDMLRIGAKLSAIGAACGMTMEACGGGVDFTSAGIRPGACIDRHMIEDISGRPVKYVGDKNQRAACGCMQSVDVGSYDTCLAGCVYCYANDSQKCVRRKWEGYDPFSPLLCGHIDEDDKIRDRRLPSIWEK